MIVKRPCRKGTALVSSRSLAIARIFFLAVIGLLFTGHGEAQQESDLLQIVSPVDGINVAPGQDITVVVQVAEGSDIRPIQIVGEDLGLTQPKLDPPYEFTIHIPSHLVGPKKIRAFGRTGPEQGVFSTPVTLQIEPVATLTALSVSPSKIFFERRGGQARLTVTGTFNDGTVKVVTESSQTSFTSNDPSVATVDSTGLVTAVALIPPSTRQVTTDIVVTHADKSVIVPVIFKPLDNVEIDIKPGSDPNTINLGSGGNVPVAIFSSPVFDATTVDPLSVTLASAPVRLKGKGTPQASSEDVNGDSLVDLVVHIDTEALQLSEASKQAVLRGKTFSGVEVRGSDLIRVAPSTCNGLI